LKLLDTLIIKPVRCNCLFTVRNHFYRRLPFKTERILSHNPRLKNAKKLLANEDVEIVVRQSNYIEAKVKGSGVVDKVTIDGENQRCTCDWFTTYQGKIGICMHTLGVNVG
jgi:hypothetical protein